MSTIINLSPKALHKQITGLILPLNIYFKEMGYEKSFDVFDIEPYVSQSSGELLTNDLTHDAKSIIWVEL